MILGGEEKTPGKGGVKNKYEHIRPNKVCVCVCVYKGYGNRKQEQTHRIKVAYDNDGDHRKTQQGKLLKEREREGGRKPKKQKALIVF